jgi:hypothetical protein
MNLNLKLKKNKFSELAGANFVAPDSEFIQEMNKQGFQALVGIKGLNGTYTIIGRAFTYYKTKSGDVGEISNTELREILGDFGRKNGKKAVFEYIEIKKDTFVWFGNINIMTVFLGTLIFVQRCNLPN